MAKKKPPRAPSAPTQWDMGPQTQAQAANKIVEPADYIDPETGKRSNPNGVKRARRVDLVEVWHRKGRLTKRQFNAADRLTKAWEATQRTAPAIRPVQVDTSPKPDANVAIMIDRMSKFVGVMGLVEREDRRIVAACVLANRTPAECGYVGRHYHAGIRMLAAALEKLAEKLERK